MFRNLELMY